MQTHGSNDPKKNDQYLLTSGILYYCQQIFTDSALLNQRNFINYTTESRFNMQEYQKNVQKSQPIEFLQKQNIRQMLSTSGTLPLTDTVSAVNHN